MNDAQIILDFLIKINSCYRCDCELIPEFTRPHCDNFCGGEGEEDNYLQEYEDALSAAKRLAYQPYIDFSKKSRKDGMWSLELCDLPNFYLRPGDIISVNQKEFTIHKINYRAENDMVKDIELIGEFM